MLPPTGSTAAAPPLSCITARMCGPHMQQAVVLCVKGMLDRMVLPICVHVCPAFQPIVVQPILARPIVAQPVITRPVMAQPAVV